MKQLSTNEIHKISEELSSILDSRIQKVLASDKGLGFELFKASEISYLWIDLDPTLPMVLHFDKLPGTIKLKKSAPIQLFLKAHLEGKRISEVQHIESLGRVINFEFGYDDPLKLEVRLFPHGANAIANYGGKKISFNKVKELKTANVEGEIPVTNRNMSDLKTQWLAKKSSKNKSIDLESVRQKEIEKKEAGLAKTKEHLEVLRNDVWAKLGEWLKANQTLDVPKELAKYIDTKKSFSINMQTCFEKAKKNQEKISGTLERIQIIESEIETLKSSNNLKLEKQNANKPTKKDNWKGYRFSVNPKVEVFVGKSAQENLNILRFAQSWDYWVHIKDYPGAHGIIRRPRGLDVTEEEFKNVACFIASRSKKSAHFLSPGDVFEVLIAECRYVRPIKGDKLGRVNYSNEKVLSVRMK